MMKHANQGVIRNALARLPAFPDLQTSSATRFLRHGVEGTSAAPAERIKTYSIAALFFGGGEDSDAVKDSNVQIEAGRGAIHSLDGTYRKRHRSENAFGHLKNWQGVATL